MDLMAKVIELGLDGMAHGGEALGRYGGKVIFVPFALPGERVRVEVLEEKEHWARARLLALLSASPDRVEPPCPYFGPGRCGGCQWQHIAYPRQAEFKRGIVADQLRRLGRQKDPAVAETIVLADDEGLLDYGYRNQAQFAAAGDGRLGYRRASSHEVMPIDRCLLLAPPLDDLHAALDISEGSAAGPPLADGLSGPAPDRPSGGSPREGFVPTLRGVRLRAGLNTGQALVLLESAGEAVPELVVEQEVACALLTPRGVQPLIGQPWIEEEVAGQRYRVSATSFFQVNTAGAAALVDTVDAYLDAEAGDTLLDAYCGVGLFTVPLAGRVREVIGIESSPSAMEDLAYNARDLGNVTLHEGPVEEVLPALVAQEQHVDLAVIDPPRAGAGPAVLGDLARLGPRRIIYVSCDPATLARDTVTLAGAGYDLREAQPIDLFPQTYHIETVAWFEKID